MSAVTRRSLLGGMSLLPLAASGALGSPFRGRRHRHDFGGGSGNLPSVGPHAAWTGAENSGWVTAVNSGVVPSNTVGGAQPVGKWKDALERYLFQDRVIGVDADAGAIANPGIAYVEFFGDIVTTRVTQQTLRTETDARGHTKKRLGYWISLNAAAFQAINSTTGVIRIYANIVANDGTMTTRVLGNNVTDAGTNFPTDHEVRMYVRTAEFDFTCTIGASGSGATFTDPTTAIAQAISAARTAGAEHPHIRVISTAFYELTDVTTGGSIANAKGHAVFTCDPGVTATLGMSADFNTEDPTHWAWRVGWTAVEFRNSGDAGGFIFDMKNWCRMNVSGSDRFKHASLWSGVRFTNSVVNDATKDFFGYWNGGSKPSSFSSSNYNFGTYTTGNAQAWDHFYDGVSEYQAPAVFQGCAYVVSGWKDRESFPNIFQVNAYGENSYFFNNSISPERNTNRGIQAMTVIGPAGATIAFAPGANNETAGSVTIKVSGTPVAGSPFALGKTVGGGNCYIADLAATINALGGGWSATVLNNTILGARWLKNFDNGSATSPPLFGINVTLTAGGSGYTSAPTVVIGAPTAGGRQATAHAVLTGDVVTSIVMDDVGLGYDTPVVACSLSGGGGTGATISKAQIASDISCSTIVTLNTANMTHSDFVISGANPIDNMLHRNLLIQDGYWNTALYDSVSANNFVMRNVLGSCQGPGARSLGTLINNDNGFAASMTHMVAHHIWMDGTVDIYNFHGLKTQILCDFYAGIGASLTSTDSTVNNAGFTINGMLYGTKNNKPFQTGSPANVFLSTTIAPSGLPATNLPAGYYSMYVNAAGGASADFSVNPSGVLPSNRVAITVGNEYDLFYNLRGKVVAGFDVPGPVAEGYTAPAMFDFATG